jgi:hypothetical protein
VLMLGIVDDWSDEYKWCDAKFEESFGVKL